MSQGTSCKCPESKKPVAERRWVVLQRNGNASAFNGYRWTYSDYSCLQCHICGVVWRTKAAYVIYIQDGTNVYNLPADQHPQHKSFGARQAALRPADYEQLPQDEQWAIDKKLGILDWNGK